MTPLALFEFLDEKEGISNLFIDNDMLSIESEIATNKSESHLLNNMTDKHNFFQVPKSTNISITPNSEYCNSRLKASDNKR